MLWIVGVGVSALVFLGLWSESKSAAEAAHRRQNEKDAIDRQTKETKQAEKNAPLKIAAIDAWTTFRDRLSASAVLIDTSFWMELEVHLVIEIIARLRPNGNPLLMEGPCFEELDRLRNKTSPVSAHENLSQAKDDRKRFQARQAIRFTETLQCARLLQVESAIRPDSNAYADPVILKRLQEQIRNGNRVVLFCADQTLRIRARTTAEGDNDLLNIVSLEDANTLIGHICVLYENGLLPNELQPALVAQDKDARDEYYLHKTTPSVRTMLQAIFSAVRA